jgi:hypothetical protein
VIAQQELEKEEEEKATQLAQQNLEKEAQQKAERELQERNKKEANEAAALEAKKEAALEAKEAEEEAERLAAEKEEKVKKKAEQTVKQKAAAAEATKLKENARKVTEKEAKEKADQLAREQIATELKQEKVNNAQLSQSISGLSDSTQLTAPAHLEIPDLPFQLSATNVPNKSQMVMETPPLPPSVSPASEDALSQGSAYPETGDEDNEPDLNKDGIHAHDESQYAEGLNVGREHLFSDDDDMYATPLNKTASNPVSLGSDRSLYGTPPDTNAAHPHADGHGSDRSTVKKLLNFDKEEKAPTDHDEIKDYGGLNPAADDTSPISEETTQGGEKPISLEEDDTHTGLTLPSEVKDEGSEVEKEKERTRGSKRSGAPERREMSTQKRPKGENLTSGTVFDQWNSKTHPIETIGQATTLIERWMSTITSFSKMLKDYPDGEPTFIEVFSGWALLKGKNLNKLNKIQKVVLATLKKHNLDRNCMSKANCYKTRNKWLISFTKFSASEINAINQVLPHSWTGQIQSQMDYICKLSSMVILAGTQNGTIKNGTFRQMDHIVTSCTADEAYQALEGLEKAVIVLANRKHVS